MQIYLLEIVRGSIREFHWVVQTEKININPSLYFKAAEDVRIHADTYIIRINPEKAK